MSDPTTDGVEERASFCRACHNVCPMVVGVRDGRLVTARGNPANPLWGGYSCVKGRGQPSLLNHPDRLLHSLKRGPDGRLTPIPKEQALDEIADKLLAIVREHGPAAIAGYYGTYAVANSLTQPFFSALWQALGSDMIFNPDTIDKPGKKIAKAMHGTWMAPLQSYDRPDVAILLGANPLQSYYGVAMGHPTRWLKEQLARGMELVVVDPRRTEIAARATLFLQPRPGHDVALLAAMIHVILAEGLHDRAFVEENATGLDELRAAVAPATPAAVAERAGVPVEDLVRVARLFAGAGRGYLCAGVGGSFSASSTLLEYLVLNLETLTGHWLRAGEQVTRLPSLLPAVTMRAQAAPPRPWAVGEVVMPATGLPNTAAGLPVNGLAAEILHDGPRRVRALVSCGGSPVGAWPDQLKAAEAMRRLDLLVHFDPWLSPTAELADYVIAPTMSYEVAGATFLGDMYQVGTYYYGPAVPHAQYSPAVVEHPPGSDLLEEWEAFYGLARRMGLQLVVGGFVYAGGAPIVVDMEHAPTSDELIEALTADGRVPLAEVKRRPAGLSVTEPRVLVEPKEPGWTGRLQLAHPLMLADLAEALTEGGPGSGSGAAAYPYRLLCRRMQQNYNSSKKDPAIGKRGYNPAFMHPADLADLGLESGDAVLVTSPRASIPAVVQADATLRPGVVSISHGFGATPERDAEFREIGSPTARLVDADDILDPYAHMPRMSDIPVAVRALGDDPPAPL